jgi:hypothetical protein
MLSASLPVFLSKLQLIGSWMQCSSLSGGLAQGVAGVALGVVLGGVAVERE